MTSIDFYFDFGSPTAYLAHKELQKMVQNNNVEVVYKPILLGGLHKATGNTPPATVPNKGKYMLMHDIPRFVARYQVPFKMNSHFPVVTLPLMRGCFAAQEMGIFEKYVDLMFDAMWVNNLNMADQMVIGELLMKNGIDAQKFAAMISDDAIKEKLKESTGEAVERGCFGAPTMFIGDEMYFGQDRLDFIKEAIA